MSIPKEKLIIQEIKEIVNNESFTYMEKTLMVKEIVNSYVDPGYIGGPVVGEEEKVRPVITPNNETRF